MTPIMTTPFPARVADPVCRAQSLAFLRFRRPDLDRAAEFLADFGLEIADRDADRLYLRGRDGTPWCYVVERGKPAFLGFGLEVGRADLDALSLRVDAAPIEPLPGPGGGLRVRLTDPGGFVVEAVAGRTPVPIRPGRPPLACNAPGNLVRVDQGQRLAIEPPSVVRLGHVVLEAAAYQRTLAWYAEVFGLIPSDVQLWPDGSPAVAFMRLDLGDQPADHHAIALAQSVLPAFSHAAFELVDADAVGMGQRILRERGWRHAWGMGRHILGSQVFDYWADPWGAKHEHYADGDVMTAAVPTGFHPVSRGAMAQWGQPMPPAFAKPAITPARLWQVLRNIVSLPDLGFAKVRMMLKAMG